MAEWCFKHIKPHRSHNHVKETALHSDLQGWFFTTEHSWLLAHQPMTFVLTWGPDTGKTFSSIRCLRVLLCKNFGEELRVPQGLVNLSETQDPFAINRPPLPAEGPHPLIPVSLSNPVLSITRVGSALWLQCRTCSAKQGFQLLPTCIDVCIE